MLDQLVEKSAVELRRLIGRKEISPVELLEASIARIEQVNPAINAMVALDLDRARDSARAAERAVLRGEALGPLHGLPLGVKDLSETAGLRTTFGSLLYKDHVPATDEAVVARMRAAGGIVLGKTNTPEFGAGANTRNRVYGATGNPFDPSLTAAGSSGGSAAAVALGMVPLASGSDMGGSLRTPAGFCGVVGLRPSPGLVPNDRRLTGWSPLSVDGPMARSVPDAALLLSAMASADAADPLAGPVDPASFAALPEIDLASLRVAVSEDLGFAPVDDGIRRTFQTRCGQFADLFGESVERDPELGDADRIFSVLRAEGFLANQVENVERSRDLLGMPVIANVEQALTFTYADRAKAHVEQTKLYRRIQILFREVDLLICPIASVSPFPHAQWAPEEINGEKLAHYFHWIALTYGLTLTGHPVVALPCGRDHKGLPFGIQIMGPRGGDRFVLGAAAALERAFAERAPLNRPIPDIARLAGAR
ncbi:MAG TPA: amidase family protein [Aliidongia sp.]|nr:amidase family protein [Aliidongia sp.]